MNSYIPTMEYASAIKMNDLLIYAKHVNDSQKHAAKETRLKIVHILGLFICNNWKHPIYSDRKHPWGCLGSEVGIDQKGVF